MLWAFGSNEIFWRRSRQTILVAFALAETQGASAAISNLWSFDELMTKANVVLIAEYVGSVDTGERTSAVGEVRLMRFKSDFIVLAALKEARPGMLGPGKHVSVDHFRPDWEEWDRDHPQRKGSPPPGLMSGLSVLNLSEEKGPYLLFLARGSADSYEPVSSQSPSDSVLLLRSAGSRLGLPPVYSTPAGK